MVDGQELVAESHDFLGCFSYYIGWEAEADNWAFFYQAFECNVLFLCKVTVSMVIVMIAFSWLTVLFSFMYHFFGVVYGIN